MAKSFFSALKNEWPKRHLFAGRAKGHRAAISRASTAGADFIHPLVIGRHSKSSTSTQRFNRLRGSRPQIPPSETIRPPVRLAQDFA
ncbi:hypothetical protein [Streptosporangium sp. CA-115845]|uniref:hypothetical protein n=1 Tax=Streptosporangium sp. CA-115845 TaxID=3240071 RepID=UPI003D93716E